MDLRSHGELGRRRALQLSATAVTGSFAGCLSSLQSATGEFRPTVQWQTDLSTVRGGPVVGPELVYVVTADEVLGLDSVDGASVWTTSASSGASISLAHGTLFLNGDPPVMDADLTALDLETHEPRWRVDRLNLWPPTVVTDETAYVTASPEPSEESALQARDLQSGSVGWRFRTEALELPVAVRDRTLYVTTVGTTGPDGSARPPGVYGLNVDDGGVEWYNDPETPWGPAVLDGDALFVGTDTVEDEAPRVHALDAASGRERWAHDGPTEHDVDYAWPVHANDDRVFVRTVGRIRALDRATGELTWDVPGEPAGDWALNRRNGLLYLRRDRTVVAVATDGTEEWTFTASEPEAQEGTVRFDVQGDEVVAVSGPTVTGLDTGSGDTNWRFEADDAVEDVAVDEGEAYVTTTGRVYALALP